MSIFRLPTAPGFLLDEVPTPRIPIAPPIGIGIPPLRLPPLGRFRFPGSLPRVPRPAKGPGPGGVPSWDFMNQDAGYQGPDSWPDEFSDSFERAGEFTFQRVDISDEGVITNCKDGRTIPGSKRISTQTYTDGNVLGYAIHNVTREINTYCGSADPVVQFAEWGIRQTILTPQGPVTGGWSDRGNIREWRYGEWYQRTKVIVRYVPLKFNGVEIKPPRRLPEGWQDPRWPFTNPAYVPAADPVVTPDKEPEYNPGQNPPEVPPNQRPAVAPPGTDERPNERPVRPPIGIPGIPVAPPARPPQPKPPEYKPGQPQLPNPGTGGNPEVGPSDRPLAPPVPIPVRPPWAEDFGQDVIGHPSERPAPTLQGLSEMTGKLEQKMRIIHTKPPAGAPPPGLDPLLEALLEFLNSRYEGGSYLLVPPCDRLPDGTMAPPVEASWPGGFGRTGELSAKLDAIATLLQAHKDQGQPVCVRQREGRPVTVILREVL